MLDLLLIFIIGMNMLMGYRKGFVATILSLLTFVLAIVITRMFQPAFTEFLMTTPLYDGMVNFTKQYLSIGDGVNTAINSASANFQAEVMERFMMPEWVANLINLEALTKNINVGAMIDFGTIETMIAVQITNYFIGIISFVGLFFISFFVLRIIAVSLNLITILPIIHSLNKTVGTLAGLLRGVIICWIILMVYMVLFMRVDTVFYEWYYGSTVALWLGERNVLLSMITSMMGV